MTLTQSYIFNCCWNLDAPCKTCEEMNNMKLGEYEVAVPQGEQQVARIDRSLPKGVHTVSLETPSSEWETNEWTIDAKTREGKPYKKNVVYATIPLKCGDKTYYENVNIGKLVGKEKHPEGKGYFKPSESYEEVFSHLEVGKPRQLVVLEASFIEGDTSKKFKRYALA